MNTSKILPCSCQHLFQDSEYGKGKRLMTRTKQASGEKVSEWRCTVCGTVKKNQIQEVVR